ncbi:MAG TPA: hypothetical protein VJR89_38825 [Polyangiales bacterium]|nr:hypothetical protein [Polyangiales bacterium]
MTSAWRSVCAATWLALGAAGCEVHTHSDWYSEYEGTLSIEWSLDDSFDPDACDDYHAHEIELIVYDDRDHEVAHTTPYCDEFEVSIDLPDGVYGLDATLLDRGGHAVTTTLALHDIDVYEDHTTPISIDFPLDSLR